MNPGRRRAPFDFPCSHCRHPILSRQESTDRFYAFAPVFSAVRRSPWIGGGIDGAVGVYY